MCAIDDTHCMLSSVALAGQPACGTEIIASRLAVLVFAARRGNSRSGRGRAHNGDCFSVTVSVGNDSLFSVANGHPPCVDTTSSYTKRVELQYLFVQKDTRHSCSCRHSQDCNRCASAVYRLLLNLRQLCSGRVDCQAVSQNSTPLSLLLHAGLFRMHTELCPGLRAAVTLINDQAPRHDPQQCPDHPSGSRNRINTFGRMLTKYTLLSKHNSYGLAE
jgi:hypothetical protein